MEYLAQMRQRQRMFLFNQIKKKYINLLPGLGTIILEKCLNPAGRS